MLAWACLFAFNGGLTAFSHLMAHFTCLLYQVNLHRYFEPSETEKHSELDMCCIKLDVMKMILVYMALCVRACVRACMCDKVSFSLVTACIVVLYLNSQSQDTAVISSFPK